MNSPPSECPSCQRELSAAFAINDECPFCGIIFSKWQPPTQTPPKQPPANRRPTPPREHSKKPGKTQLAGLLMTHRQQLLHWAEGRMLWPRALVVLFMAYIGFRYLLNPSYRTIFDGINLGIHEAGHLVFAIFPEFLTFLGGTLLQLAAPIICGVLLFRQSDPFGTSFCGTWLASNCYHVAIYQADARAQELPLVTVGGGVPIHDWAYMLSRLNILSMDTTLAFFTRCVGFLIAWAAVAYACWILSLIWQNQKTPFVEIPLSHQ